MNTLRSEISPARTRFQGLRKELKHLRSSYTTVNKSLDLWNAQEAGPHGRWETAGFQTLVKCQEGGSQAFTTQLVTCFQQEVPATAPSLLSGHVRGTAGCQAPATQSLPPLAGMCVCVRARAAVERPLPRSARGNFFFFLNGKCFVYVQRKRASPLRDDQSEEQMCYCWRTVESLIEDPVCRFLNREPNAP